MPPVAELVDLVVADPGPVVAMVEAAPQAAVTLALVLRAGPARGVPAGLAAESAAYRGRGWDVVGFFWKRSHPESALRRAAKQLAGDLSAVPPPDCE